MQSIPTEWDATLLGLLTELNDLYEELRTGCRTVRSALVKHDNAAVLGGVRTLQQIISRARAGERRVATVLREGGLLEPGEPFTLLRVGQRDAIRNHPELAPRLARTAETAAAAAREAALNRRLIERLSVWLQREARILLEPFMEPSGYGATGQRREGAVRPARLDRRG